MDRGVLENNMEVLIRTGLCMVLIAVLGGIAGVSAGGFSGAAFQSFGNDLRKDLYQKMMDLSLAQTDPFTTGSLITRLTKDITMVQKLVEMALRMFVRAPLTFLGGVVKEIGNHETLLAQRRAYYPLYQSQFAGNET